MVDRLYRHFKISKKNICFTGDCVTTFKAGEDRFLNSLLVSGDGRILVCGDETQKPFPLLVWNLKSKKLLYDLRIPHHDFITSLSAITYEGSFIYSSCFSKAQLFKLLLQATMCAACVTK